jgi:hypothetical protein
MRALRLIAVAAAAGSLAGCLFCVREVAEDVCYNHCMGNQSPSTPTADETHCEQQCGMNEAH